MIVVFIGPPGSGKGTQAKMLAADTNLFYLSTGEMLRELKKTNNQLAQIMDSGDLIPDDQLVQYTMDYLFKNKVSDKFIIDGSPRTVYQYEKFVEEFEKMGKQMNIIIYLHISDEEVIKRQSARRKDRVTGKVYNLITNPPGPEVLAENLEQREDDKLGAIKNRIRVYHEQTQPLVEKLKSEGVLKVIDGERAIAEIYADIKKIVEENA